MPHSAELSPAPIRSLATLPPFSRVLMAIALALATWEERRLSRRALARLDPHMLRDVGLTMQSRADESAKPFWRD